MASSKRIEKAVQRMAERRSNVKIPNDRDLKISDNAARELVQYMKDLNSFRARSYSESANRIAR